jgi:hypothetical protein
MVKLKRLIMKKLVFISSLLVLNGFYALAQNEVEYKSNTSTSTSIYEVPDGQTPVAVQRIGVYPQFPALCNKPSAEEWYSGAKALSSDPRYGAQLNNLFIGMGYTGLDDPNFDAADVTLEPVPFGAMGMMGGRGNKYKYSIITVPNEQNVTAFKVKSKDEGKDLYFFAGCGNAFFYNNQPTAKVQYIDREKVVKDYSGYANVKVKVYARHRQTETCAWCSKCEDLGEETVLLSDEDINQIPVVREGTEAPVKKVYVDVDKATFKKIKASEENGQYEYKEKVATKY